MYKYISLIFHAFQWIWRLLVDILIRIEDFIIIGWLSVYYIAEAFITTLTPSFLRSKKSLKGMNILVTGGAGGVGQELVLRLAREHANVIVWDNNEKAMKELEEQVGKEGYKVHTYVVDVSDRENVYKNADLIKIEIGPVDILINNAGIVCGQTLLDIPDYMIEKTFKVNILAHYWTTKAFLPDMMQDGRGHIVTVGSLTGLLGTYRCVDYSATKFATIGFHESLLTELKTHGYDDIKMTLVCPYFINTGMFAGCKPRNMKMLEPKDVAKRIIAAIKNEEVYVTMPAISRYILPLKNFIPVKLSWAFMYRIIQGPQSMMGMRQFQEANAA